MLARIGSVRRSQTQSGQRLTVLLNTQSRFPSSVYIFMAHPCTSRTVSAEPRSGPTVEMRRRSGVVFPMALRKLAEVRSVQSWVHLNSPYALEGWLVRLNTGQRKLAVRHTLPLWRERLCRGREVLAWSVRMSADSSLLPFRNSLAGKVRKSFYQLGILEQDQAAAAAIADLHAGVVSGLGAPCRWSQLPAPFLTWRSQKRPSARV